MSQKQLILLSGGLDSVVLSDVAAEQDSELSAIYFSYGFQPSLGELGAARHAASRLQIPLEVVDIKSVAQMLVGHAPPEWIMADEADMIDPEPAGVILPSGYHVLLSIATYYAQVRGIDMISVGLLREQVENRPGIPNFLQQWSSAVRALNDSHPELNIDAPLLERSKPEVVGLGAERGIDLAATWSCFKGGLQQCGVCASCRSRRSAFKAAEIEDKTLYEHT